MDLNAEIKKLLEEIGPGKMSSTAYDTAWVARLGEIDWDLSSRALAWLSENQLPDGSWGASQPYYYHDRIISTLSAMIALTYRGRRNQDKVQIERGLIALEKITEGATQGLSLDPNGATVGFEMIVPTLVEEAEKLGIIKQQGERVLGRLSRMREDKLAKIQGKLINRQVTMAFSAEMAGLDGQHMLDIPNLKEENNSVGHSPSATAYYCIYINPYDDKALDYLRGAITRDGGAPDLYPFDIYERAWVLWNLNLFQGWNEKTFKSMQPHLDYLKASWQMGQGVGFSDKYSVSDGDDTIITFDLLKRYGYDVDLEGVLAFEEEDHFRCYQLEVGISPSVNIHALIALYQAGFELSHPTVQKVLNFIQSAQWNGRYWIDKWHSSPFYTTAHFVMAVSNYSHDIAAKSVEWILSNQREDGAWGFFTPTTEETAYSLQALSIWQQKTNKVEKDVFQRGLSWLERNANNKFLPLWIGKGLYSADNVVKSALYSAISLTRSVM